LLTGFFLFPYRIDFSTNLFYFWNLSHQKFHVMKKSETAFLLLITVITSIIFILSGCNKDDDKGDSINTLSVDFPRLVFKHNLYYSLDDEARSIEMIFSESIDPGSVDGNILLSDKSGNLDVNTVVDVSEKAVIISFHPDFYLKHGWKYELLVSAGLKSISGNSLKQDKTFELRTTGKHVFNTQVKAQNSQRNSIIAISDIHMGDKRASDSSYCWFGKNAAALENLLDSILFSNTIRELVIQGDLFDEWIVPYSLLPFDTAQGISGSLDYFKAIAESPVNVAIFEKFKQIAAHEEISLVYIPGNHDMLILKEYLEQIIPGIVWKGDADGLGKYEPASDIIMEHGHRYDFFNCPQPLVNPGHMLPPGYFISRLYAQGMMESAGMKMKSKLESAGSAEFISAWSLAIIYTLGDFNMNVPPLDDHIILMSGIDGYDDAFSFNGAQNMYAANIEDLWPQTQTQNNVPVPMDVLFAIWHGYDLTTAALYEYLYTSPHLSAYKVVSFGHSHKPGIDVYPAGNMYEGLYANSGSWIDADQCDYDVRTYLVINPAEWTGSELDVVMLYQVNLDSSTPNGGYLSELLDEENIE